MTDKERENLLAVEAFTVLADAEGDDRPIMKLVATWAYMDIKDGVPCRQCPFKTARVLREQRKPELSPEEIAGRQQLFFVIWEQIEEAKKIKKSKNLKLYERKTPRKRAAKKTATTKSK
jgi:arginine/ornithine N-succinyltransferase beta subunit